MSATWKTKAEEIIDRCENKPNQDEWMTVKRCLNKLQEDLKCFSEKYPEEAKKRKIQLNTRSSTMPNSDALKNDDVTTVVKYLKKAHTYHHDLPKPKAEAAMRDFSDMVDCLFYFKQIEQEQGKGKNVSVIDVQGGTAPPGTGGQQKDLDEIFSDSKKPKNVFDSEFSKTHNKNQTRGSKDNTLSKTLPPNLSKNEIPPKREKQEGTTRTDREENKDEKERLINVADVRNKFQSDSLSKTVVHSKPANSPKPTTKSTGQTFSKTLPTTKQFKNGIQKDGEKLEIAEGGKEMEAGKKCENSAGDSKDNEFKQKIQELESKIKEMENKNKTLNETVNVTENRSKFLEAENTKLLQSKEEFKSRFESMQTEMTELYESNQQLRLRYRETENRCSHLNQQFDREHAQSQELRIRLHNAESRNADVESENKYLKEQVDELTMRLSSFASKQLSEGNPNVADLSDQNRPTKIGEKFGALYDDEWSDAFDALNSAFKSNDDAKREANSKSEDDAKVKGDSKSEDEAKSEDEVKREDEVIKYLIEIIQKSYEFCTKTAHEQLEKLNETMRTIMKKFDYKDKEGQVHAISSSTEEKPNIDSTRAKYAKDYRKAVASESLLGVKKMFKETVLKEELDKLSDEAKEPIIAYIDKCTELIWFMVVQDPPMVFEIPEPGKPFNANAFKPYKQKGKNVRLAVWPAVKLSKNGGLISKGYALPV